MARYVNSTPQILDGSGDPLVGAKKYFYETGTTTLKTIYSDSGLSTSRANPVESDSDGRFPEIFISGIYNEVQKDANDVTIWSRDPVGESTVITGDTALPNGSFEENTGTPINWTIAADSGATIQTDTTNVRHGLQSLKFDGGGSGGGTATSDKFPVRESSTLEVKFSFYATNATTTNTVEIKWYDEDGAASATPSTTVYTATSGHPTSWTDYSYAIGSPSDATQAEIVLTGIASSGSNLSADAYFDGVVVSEKIGKGSCLVYKSADETITTSTYTHLSFDSEDHDTANIHDPSTNNQRLTVPTGVTKVRLSGNVIWAASGTTGIRAVLISKNDETTTPTGVSGLPYVTMPFLSGFIECQNPESSMIDVIAGDYFTLCVYHTEGSDHDVDAVTGNSYYTWFAMEIIE